MLPTLAPVLVLFTAPSPAQESRALLDAPLFFGSAHQRMDHLLDMNGDGRMDFVSYLESWSSAQMDVYLNDGAGGRVAWASSTVQADYPKTSHHETCEADGDGRDDLVWVLKSTPSSHIAKGFMRVFSWEPGNGMRRIEHLGHEEVASTVQHGSVFDADYDGDADRVRVMDNHFDGTFLLLDLFEQDASGEWSSESQSLELASVPRAMKRVDYDGDAYPDVYLDYGTSGLFVPLAYGTIHEPVEVEHGVVSSEPRVIPGDVDGDGDEDLAIFGFDHYALLRRVGPASWSVEPVRPSGPVARLADVDGDGDLDGVCCGGSGSSYALNDQPSTFRISLNDGTGAFALPFLIPSHGSRAAAGAADLDGDGDVDLVGGQCIYYARGPLTARPQRALAGPQSARALVDFDRDGDADFAPGIGAFRRHLGDGSSHDFTLLCPAPPPGRTDEGPGLPGDWDGDGDADLVVRRRAAGTFEEMRLLRNEGGGTYADGGTAGSVDFLPGAEVRAESSFAADLDLDGDLDLVTFRRAALWTDSWTRSWTNDGYGRFALAWERLQAWPLAFAPLHGSAAPDALLVCRPTMGNDRLSEATLHPGLGDGSFEAAGVLALRVGYDVGAASVAAADLDDDGDVDLAGAFEFGGSDSRQGMGWYLPNLGGSLSLAQAQLLDVLAFQSLETPPRPVARVAHAVDVDLDGRLDVVLSSPDNRRAAISIVLRKADNSGWEAPVRQAVYPVDPLDPTNVVAHAGAWLDLDGDGDSDLVTDAVWNGNSRDAREWGSRRQGASGIADADGRVPTLGASGPFRPGEELTVTLTNVPSSAPGVLGLAASGGPRSLTERYLPKLSFVTLGPPAEGAGHWSISFPIPISFALAGHRLRAVVVDPEEPARPLQSNTLDLRFGPP